MNKWFDKLTDNRNFMKLAALVLALLLFGSVYDANKEKKDIYIPGESETETITGIPVKSYYDTEHLVVTGMPETVEVTLDGPTPNLQAAKTQKDFEVYADLSKVNVGTQRVKLQIRDLSENLKAKINPSSVEITVQEKVTKEFTVQAEYNQEMIAEGYVADTPVVKPNKVKITGGKDEIDKVSFVKAIVEINRPLTATAKRNATVMVRDENLNQLNVEVEEGSVEVTIPIKLASKNVPISIVRNGELPEGVAIDSITLEKNQAKITGNEDILNTTNEVRVEVDISTISANTELTLPVIISEGIKEVDPKTVKAMVRVTLNSEAAITSDISVSRTLSNLPINIIGLSEEQNAVIDDPLQGRTSLTVKGTNETIEKLKETDFQLSVNLADLTEGEHQVKIDVKAPENITWTLANETASINISVKDG